MAKYLDGIQQTTDAVIDYEVIASGTLAVGVGGQYPYIDLTNKPSKFYRNYALMVYNRTGQVMSSTQIMPLNANGLVSNLATTNTLTTNGTTLSVANNGAGIYEFLSKTYLFFNGKVRLAFNLAAVTSAAGSIDYALIGY